MFVQEDMTHWQDRRCARCCPPANRCNPEIIEHVRKVWGLTVREGYGQTETTLQIGCFPGETVKPGSMGQEAPGYRIRLLDADGQRGGGRRGLHRARSRRRSA